MAPRPVRLVDVAKELGKQAKAKKQLEKSIKLLQAEIAKPAFAAVPESVKEKKMASLAEAETKLASTRSVIAMYEAMQ